MSNGALIGKTGHQVRFSCSWRSHEYHALQVFRIGLQKIWITQTLRQKPEYATQQIKHHFVFRVSIVRIQAAVQITSWNARVIIKLNTLLDLFTVWTDNSYIALEIVLLNKKSGAFAGFARTGNAVTKPRVRITFARTNTDKNSGVVATQAVRNSFCH